MLIHSNNKMEKNNFIKIKLYKIQRIRFICLLQIHIL